MGKSKKPKVPPKPSITFEDFAEADRVFRASLEGSLYMSVPGPGDVDHEDDVPLLRKGEKARKRRREDTPVIDLHGMTLQQAKEYLDDRLQRLLGSDPAAITVKIVTGKGLHSGPGGGVLAKEIHSYVVAVYARAIVSIEDSPADTVIRGLPLRGYFRVQLRRP